MTWNAISFFHICIELLILRGSLASTNKKLQNPSQAKPLLMWHRYALLCVLAASPVVVACHKGWFSSLSQILAFLCLTQLIKASPPCLSLGPSLPARYVPGCFGVCIALVAQSGAHNLVAPHASVTHLRRTAVACSLCSGCRL